MTKDAPKYWRSLEALDPTPEYTERTRREFPEGVTELAVPPHGRRAFMGMMSASMALAGATFTGCVRKPREKILPYAKRPEDLVPGKPRYFSAYLGGSLYYQRIADVKDKDYEGFVFERAHRAEDAEAS